MGSSAARLKLEMSMNAKPQETFAEGASLNEITNRVFEELLQGKSEAQNLKVKSLDQHSIKVKIILLHSFLILFHQISCNLFDSFSNSLKIVDQKLHLEYSVGF